MLDAIAIAGQVMVGRLLGAGDAAAARAASRRMIGLALAIGVLIGALLLAGIRVIPEAFTNDPAVVDRAGELWPWFAALLPIGALVFALDGILIGAGDTRYLAWAMVGAAVVFAPALAMALVLDLDVAGIWAALDLLIAARLATLWWRYRGERWVVLGAKA